MHRRTGEPKPSPTVTRKDLGEHHAGIRSRPRICGPRCAFLLVPGRPGTPSHGSDLGLKHTSLEDQASVRREGWHRGAEASSILSLFGVERMIC